MVIADSMLPIVTIVLAASALLHLGHGAADLPPRPKPLTPDKDSRSSSSSGRSTPGLHYPPIIQMPADIKRTATAFAVLVRHLQELSPEGVLAVGWDLGIAKSELPNYQSLCGGRTSRTIASHEAFTKIYRLSSMYIRVDSKRGMRPNLLAAALHYVVHDHHNNADLLALLLQMRPDKADYFRTQFQLFLGRGKFQYAAQLAKYVDRVVLADALRSVAAVGLYEFTLFAAAIPPPDEDLSAMIDTLRHDCMVAATTRLKRYLPPSPHPHAVLALELALQLVMALAHLMGADRAVTRQKISERVRSYRTQPDIMDDLWTIFTDPRVLFQYDPKSALFAMYPARDARFKDLFLRLALRDDLGRYGAHHTAVFRPLMFQIDPHDDLVRQAVRIAAGRLGSSGFVSAFLERFRNVVPQRFVYDLHRAGYQPCMITMLPSGSHFKHYPCMDHIPDWL